VKVVHVVTAFARNEMDPITPWLVELVFRLRTHGVEASVLAPAYRGGGATEIRGIPVRRFRYAPARWEDLTHDETVPDRVRHDRRYGALVPAYLLAGMRAAFVVGRGRPDVVHVHWPMPHALFGAAARLGSGGSSSVVSSFYSVELNWVVRRMPALIPFLRWAVRSADEVTAISNATAAGLETFSSRPVTIIPYGAAIEDDGRPPARSALSGDGPLRLLFVGRLVERKGVEVLVRALALLDEDPGARLTVVGEGSWEDRIRDVARECGVEDRVEFTGRVSEAELVRQYLAADIFVLPAVEDSKGDSEGLGVVLLEALRFERPVVASEIGGIPDIVHPERTGWLVPSGDPVALAATLRTIAQRPEMARSLARQGRARVRERFGWAPIVDQTLACYKRAIERRNRG